MGDNGKRGCGTKRSYGIQVAVYFDEEWRYASSEAKLSLTIIEVTRTAPSRQELRDEFETLAAEYLLNVDVFSSGPTTATIAIVGEGPGETEVRNGTPFIGGAGKLLFDSLARFGLHRENVYTTNVVKRQISLSRKGNERHVVHRDELDKWLGLSQLGTVSTSKCAHHFCDGQLRA
jgi:hypothetical protein